MDNLKQFSIKSLMFQEIAQSKNCEKLSITRTTSTCKVKKLWEPFPVKKANSASL